MNRLYRSLIAAIILILAAGTVFAESFVNLPGMYDSFKECIYDGDYDRAAAIYNAYGEGLNSYSSNEAQLYLMYAEGMIMLRDEKIDEACVQFNALSMLAGKDFPEAPAGIYMASCSDVSMYLQGRLYEKSGDYENALACYTNDGLYADSLDRYMDILGRLSSENGMSRFTPAMVASDASSVIITWFDSVQEESYRAVCMPAGGGHAIEKETGTCSVTFEDLLPDTTYSVSVFAGSGECFTATVSTKPAASLSREISRDERLNVEYCKESDAQRLSLSNLKTRGLLTSVPLNEDGNREITVSKGYAQGYYRYYLSTSLYNNSYKETSFDWCLILRTEEKGAYSVCGTSLAPLPAQLMPTPYMFNLTDLMGEYFELCGGTWAETNGTIELYINGMYADEAGVHIHID